MTKRFRHNLHNYLLCSFVFISIQTNAQIGWQWVKQPSTTLMEAYLCATDKWGNVYGGGGSFITKYDTSGNFRWSHIVSTGAFLIAISADNLGDVYVLGAYPNTTISVSSYVLHNSHPPDNQFFLAKYDTSGGLKWAKNIGTAVTSSLFSYLNAIVIDAGGYIYLTLPFSNNPVLGSYTFSNHDASNSTNDFLVAKLDSSGNVVWAEGFGGDKNDNPAGITISSSTIFVAGMFTSDTLTFGSTILTDTFTEVNSNSCFVSKLSISGAPIWAKGGRGSCKSIIPWGIVADDSGSAIITGQFAPGTAIFGTDTFMNYNTTYSYYGFVTKYDSTGNITWAKETNNCVGTSIARDYCDNIWICGWMRSANDTVDGHVVVPASSADAIFLAGWNSTGSFLNASSLGSGGDDWIGLATDCRGNAYVCGDYENTIIAGSDTLFYGGSGEFIFISKYYGGTNCNKCDNYTEFQNDIITSSTINLYPNPVTNELVITTSDNLTSITINNLLGQPLYNTPCSGEKVQINVSDLPAGIYLIRINGTEIRRFVKQ